MPIISTLLSCAYNKLLGFCLAYSYMADILFLWFGDVAIIMLTFMQDLLLNWKDLR